MFNSKNPLTVSVKHKPARLFNWETIENNKLFLWLYNSVQAKEIVIFLHFLFEFITRFLQKCWLRLLKHTFSFLLNVEPTKLWNRKTTVMILKLSSKHETRKCIQCIRTQYWKLDFQATSKTISSMYQHQQKLFA